MISIRNVKKQYGKIEVISSLNLDVQDGEFLVILGPSGCGKTTLLRMIAGLEDITAGDIMFDDVRVNDMPPKERNISMVFQNYALFPNMNVYENIAFGLKVRKHKKDEIDTIVKEIADNLKISHLLKRKPSALSGGEQQRVAIARAMVKRPNIYLFDEPLSSLDVNLKGDLRKLIKNIHEETKATFIYVTHDQNEALALADRIVVMNSGDIIEVDTPTNLYSSPKTEFVARFIGEPKINMLKINDSTYTCGIRPECISVGEKEGYLTLEGDVLSNDFIGNGYVVTIELGHETIKLLSSEAKENKIKLSFNPCDAILFDAKGYRADIDNTNLMVKNNQLYLEGER